MRTIKNIDAQIEHFIDDNSFPEDQKKQIPTFRQMFKAAVGLSLSKDGEQAIDLYQLGLKLKISESDINLEDAEFKLLKEKCGENPAKWIGHFHGQVMQKLKDSEK
jgi:hypothetical protein